MSEHTQPIVVMALDREQRFKDLDALQAHVDEILEARGGIFTPLELAAIRELAKRGNGSTPPHVAHIARSTAIWTPAKPERGPSPYDERIAEAEERLAQRDEALAVAMARREAVEVACDAEYARAASNAKSPADAGGLSSLRETLRSRSRDAADDYRRVNEARVRASARLNALKIARDRWYAVQELERTRRD